MFVTKARAWKGEGQKCNLGISSTLWRVRENVREWTHTFLSGFPFWKLEFRGTFELLESDLKGQNSLYLKVLHTIEKLLKCRCLKWTHIIHLNTYNTSFGHKKGRESKCQFDSWPLKVRDRLELRGFKGPTTYCWKVLDKGYKCF
jgi:hypothetical protein